MNTTRYLEFFLPFVALGIMAILAIGGYHNRQHEKK